MGLQNPDQCLCCDLKLGILIWGTICLVAHVIVAGYLIYGASELHGLHHYEAYFWTFLIFAIIILIFVLVKASFLYLGVGGERLNLITGFIVILYIEIVLGVIGIVGEAMHRPASIVGLIVGVVINVYYILCVKSYRSKLENRGNPVPVYHAPAPGYQPQMPGYQPQAPGYQPQAPGYQPQAPGYQQPAPAYPVMDQKH